MKFYIIEWWDTHQNKYHQEYFKTASVAFARFTDLDNNVPESDPRIETKNFEDA